MERISDERLDFIIKKYTPPISELTISVLSALVELRERRAKDAPCPEHAKIVSEWNKK
jgi:hypothetical protein